MSKLTTNALTNGAIMAALVVLFCMMSMLPLAGSIALFIAGVPLSVQCVRYNAKSALLAGIAAGILVSILGGLNGALTAFVQVLPLGMTVGIMLKKRQSPLATFIGAAVVSALGVCFNFLVTAWVMGISLTEMINMMFPPFDDLIKMYEEMGLLAALTAQGTDMEMMRELYEKMIGICRLLLPAVVLFVGLVGGGAHYFVTVKILKRLRIKVRKFPRFDKWYLPAWSAYGLILALLGWVFGDRLPSWLHAVVLNVLFIYSVVLFVVGLAVIARWLNIRKQSAGMKVLWGIGAAFVAMSNFSLLVSGLGAFDILMDFRHIHPNDQLLPKFLLKNKKQPEEQSAEQPPKKKIRRDK